MKNILSIILLISLFCIMRTNLIDHSEQITKILDSFSNSSPKELFKIWHLIFKRDYTFDSEEAKLRFRNFKMHLALIKEINSKDLGYTFGLNQFSDMSAEEFEKTYLTRRPNLNLEKDLNELNQNLGFIALNPDDDDDLTKRNLQSNIDYTPLFLAARNQGNCGSCWTFSSAGAIEGNYAKKTGRPVAYLSTQQLVDCDRGNGGCNGGDMMKAYNYVQKAGLMSEADYKYTAKEGSCKYSSSKAVNKIKGYDYCSNYGSKKCTTEIFYALLARGPLGVGIDGDVIQVYKSGIYKGSCNLDNHAVVAVGYGSSGSSYYWIVRNSWGASWGEKGYIRVQGNIKNKYSCFVENEGTLPTV